MLSSIKKVVLAGLIAGGAVATLSPVQAIAAPNNGGGVVYHKSDCGKWNVRFYGGGGSMSGSTCGYWLDPNLLRFIWSRDHNWSACDLAMTNHRLWSNAGFVPGFGTLNPTDQDIENAVAQTSRCGY